MTAVGAMCSPCGHIVRNGPIVGGQLPCKAKVTQLQLPYITIAYRHRKLATTHCMQLRYQVNRLIGAGELDVLTKLAYCNVRTF